MVDFYIGNCYIAHKSYVANEDYLSIIGIRFDGIIILLISECS